MALRLEGATCQEQILNVNKSPLPLVLDFKKTYKIVESRWEENCKDKVQVTMLRIGKIQYTLWICFRLEDKQSKAGILFEAWIKEFPKLKSWHAYVDVFR